MKRTVTALYETQAEAERVRDALKAAGLGDDVEVHDRDADDARGHLDLFGGHHDSHLYAEGLRRGHVLLTAKVDDLNETRAAEIIDAEAPVDLTAAEKKWREEGWKPEASETHHTHRIPLDTGKFGLIELRAYALWENEGCPRDRALANWLQAEAEVNGVIAKTSAAPESKARSKAK
jgi:hypothetical protein